jgi:hypothetical protein
MLDRDRSLISLGDRRLIEARPSSLHQQPGENRFIFRVAILSTPLIFCVLLASNLDDNELNNGGTGNEVVAPLLFDGLEAILPLLVPMLG